jgi:hypothetical protein
MEATVNRARIELAECRNNRSGDADTRYWSPFGTFVSDW